MIARAVTIGIGSAQAATPDGGHVTPVHTRQPGRAHPVGAVSLPAKQLQHFSHLLHSQKPAKGVHPENQTSTNWAGYAADNGTFTTVTSSWVEPDVSCTSGAVGASGSDVTPLPNFSSVNFTGSTFNNGSMSGAGAQGIDMTDGSGNVIATTGPDDGNGDFTVTYGG